MTFFRKGFFRQIFDILPAKKDSLDKEKIERIESPLDLKYSFLTSDNNFSQEKKRNFSRELFSKEIIKSNQFTFQKPSFLKRKIKFLILFLILFIFLLGFFLFIDKKIIKIGYHHFFKLENFNLENYLFCLKEAKKDLDNFDILAAKINFDKSYLIWQEFSQEVLASKKIFLASLTANDLFSLLKEIDEVMGEIKIILNDLDNLTNKELVLSLLDEENYQRGAEKDLREIEKKIDNLSLSLKEIKEILKKVDLLSLPSDWQKTLKDFQKNYLLWQGILAEKKSLLTKIERILAGDDEKRYLLLIQDEDTSRANGGLIKYLVFLSLEDYSLKEIKSYQAEDISLNKKIIPPHPFWLSEEKWQLRDMNYFFDFPLSAGKIISFFEEAENKKVDGLIALNKMSFLEILDILGPLNEGTYEEFRASDFFEKIEESFSENQSDTFFKNFFFSLFKKIAFSEREKKKEFLEKIKFLLLNKDIQIYFQEKNLENWLKERNFSGEVLRNKENQDYLAIVSTNVEGGGDSFVEEESELLSTIKEDGSIINKLKIKRSFLTKGRNFSINRIYLRIYLPLGSQLISFQGGRKRIIKPLTDFSQPEFLIDNELNEIEKDLLKDKSQRIEFFQESGKTVLATWLEVGRGGSCQLTIEYQLPFKLSLAERNKISLLYQKQSSSDNSLLWQINLPKDYLFANERDTFEVYYPKPKKFEEISLKFFKKAKKKEFFSERTDEEMIVSSLLPVSGRGATINLTKMEVNLYQNRKKIKTLFLVSRGERGKWFQTPLGYFEVMAKKNIVHSSKVDVYMPWSIQFYQDFFIHGIPYYSNYQKVSSSFSGGCLRLKDSQAKYFYDFARIGMPVILYEDKNLISLGKNFVLPIKTSNFWLKKDFNSPFNIRGYYGPTDVWDTEDKYYQHTGLDFACSEEVPVVAIGPAKVVKIQELGNDHGMGKTIILEHNFQQKKFYSLYAHLSSIREDLKVGDLVEKGEIIGLMGDSGYGCQYYWRVGEDGCQSKNPLDIHLHFEIKEKPVLENPRGGKVCLNKFNQRIFCYGYTPKDPREYGYFDPIEILKK